MTETARSRRTILIDDNIYVLKVHNPLYTLNTNELGEHEGEPNTQT